MTWRRSATAAGIRPGMTVFLTPVKLYDAVTIPDYIAISVLIVLILIAAARLFARSNS